jgi:hypothetical protein
MDFMHFDLAHAAIIVGALIVTNMALKASGILDDESDRRFGAQGQVLQCHI